MKVRSPTSGNITLTVIGVSWGRGANATPVFFLFKNGILAAELKRGIYKNWVREEGKG